MRISLSWVLLMLCAFPCMVALLCLGLLHRDISAAQRLQFAGILLEADANKLGDHIQGLLDSLPEDANALALNEILNEKGVAPYKHALWETDGELLYPEDSPAWAQDVSLEKLNGYLDDFVNSGVRIFRQDNFSEYQSGKTNEAICAYVAYLPKQRLFIGLGGVSASLSARLNALESETWERQKLYAAAVLILLISIILLCFTIAYKYLDKKIKAPLLELAGGAREQAKSGGGLSQEIYLVGATITELKKRTETLSKEKDSYRERATELAEALSRIEADYDYLLAESTRALETMSQHQRVEERNALYRRVQNAVSGADGAHLRLLQLCNTGDKIETDDLLETTLDDWLRDFLRNYVTPLAAAPPKLNVLFNPRLLVDSTRIAVVLRELLDNVYSHSGKEGSPLQASITCIRNDLGGVDVCVGALGGGIGIGDRAIIFAPFYSTKLGQAGLGLTWARAQCLAMKFGLRVYSEEGKGFVAVLEIPYEAFAQDAGSGVN